MDLDAEFNKIIETAHFWNWAPDWDVVAKIYKCYENSYSVLLPFAYIYLEELIRSMTPDYGNYPDDLERPKRHLVGKTLVKCALKANKDKEQLCIMLSEALKYFDDSRSSDLGNNRNNVLHGYMHPRFWDKDSFEDLIRFIARLSEFANF